MGRSGDHCSSGGAFGSCSGTTTSVSVTRPPADSITLKARRSVEATIDSKVWLVYEKGVVAIAGMPDFQASGMRS